MRDRDRLAIIGLKQTGNYIKIRRRTLLVFHRTAAVIEAGG
jgi:hypothetical protein